MGFCFYRGYGKNPAREREEEKSVYKKRAQRGTARNQQKRVVLS